MKVSYLIITFNRREGLLANLQSVFENAQDADVWIVDNASVDGTSDAVRAAYPRVRLIQLDRNLGMPARNVALRQMTSEYVVLLDDDSYPVDDAIERSIEFMDDNRDVAAVVGRAVLPDGRSEASALPSVMLGCATCLRMRALRDVGFFPADFFRQAEEYDLSLRLWDAGYRIERFEDICYRHDKKPSASRASREVATLDLKNNLILAARYLPLPIAQSYWEDFEWRYGAILRHAGYEADIGGVIEDVERIVSSPSLLRRQPISAAAFESVFGMARQRRSVTAFAQQSRLRYVAIADASKNLFATFEACRDAGVEVKAILDDRPAFAGQVYRGVPVIARRDLQVSSIDGVVLSNTNPAQVADEIRALADSIDRPLLRLWTPRTLNKTAAMRIAA